MDDVVIDLDELTAKLIASMNIDGLIERAWKAERERDEARAELSALRTEVLRAELDERVHHERADDACAERDEARAALTALVAGLGLDDTPRRAAIDAARALVKSWEAT